MPVPSVAKRTVPVTAKLSELLHIVTPLCWQKWEEHLAEAGLLETFADVPKGIRFGFDLGVDGKPLTTYIPRNHKSALDNPAAVEAYIEAELEAGRYLGPFDSKTLEERIGYFLCSPMGVIEEPTKFRIIQDHSFP
jgi:hypothetical protein